MSLTMQQTTGCLPNEVLIRQHKEQPDPKVGMGATLLGWTDRYAATIIEITGGVLTVREDHAKRIDTNCRSDHQLYEYTANPAGGVSQYRLDNGVWVGVTFNDRTKRFDHEAEGYALIVGIRDHYFDFSF